MSGPLSVPLQGFEHRLETPRRTARAGRGPWCHLRGERLRECQHRRLPRAARDLWTLATSQWPEAQGLRAVEFGQRVVASGTPRTCCRRWR